MLEQEAVVVALVAADIAVVEVAADIAIAVAADKELGLLGKEFLRWEQQARELVKMLRGVALQMDRTSLALPGEQRGREQLVQHRDYLVAERVQAHCCTAQLEVVVAVGGPD